ncbi:putative cytochrome P450 6d4, partial [Pseudolycoriella hygida]
MHNHNQNSLTQRSIPTNENGVIGSRPALSNHWVTSRPFTRYCPLPVKAGKVDEEPLQEWLTESDWFKKDLVWLLRLEHHRVTLHFGRLQAKMILFVLLLFVILLVIFAKWLINHMNNYWERLGVKYVPPSLPFGNFGKTFRKKISIGELLQEFYQTLNEPFFGLFSTHKPVLVVSDPHLIRLVLVKDFQSFSDRGFYMDEKRDPLTANLFSLGGEKWKQWRTKLSPAFTTGKVKAMFSSIVECGEPLESHVMKLAERKSSIEIREVLAGFTTNAIASTAFGLKIDCIANPETPFRKYGKKYFSLSIKNGFRIMAQTVCPMILKFFRIKAMDQDVEDFFIDSVKQTLFYRENNNIVRPDFFQLLVQLRNTGFISRDDVHTWETKIMKNESDKALTLNEVAAQAFIFFVAGFETSSGTMAYCLHELAVNQELQSRVHREIDEVIKKHDGKVTYECIADLKFLECCIDETLRKYPTLPVLTRQCTIPYTIPGTNVCIEKGTLTMIPTLALHRDPKFYPKPDTFDPDRFYVENIGSKPFVDQPYLPFGVGGRICPGMRSGKLTTKIGLLKMLHKFRYHLDGPADIKFSSSSLVLSPEHEFWSQILYEPACIVSITSFLQDANPYYLPVSSLTSNKNVLQGYKDILTLTLSLLYRLLTVKESEAEWMSPSELGDIIYTNYIITIPMAMDMLIAYGRSNIETLTELLERIFSFNENYISDLITAMRDLEKSFQVIQQKYDENDEKTSFDDLATFTLDCCATVGILLTAYPPARQYALQIKLEQCITNFYDVTIPKLYQQIHTINPESKSLAYLNESRVEILGSFLLLSNYYLDQILNEPGESLKAAESLLAILQEALSDQIFLTDYQRLHPVVNDIEILQQACPQLDMFKVDYILNAYISNRAYGGPLKNGHNFVEDQAEPEGAMALPIENSNPNEQIQEVLNIFPHLTIDFVEKLLQRYESTEKAIAEYLEGNLPPDLIENDIL